MNFSLGLYQWVEVQRMEVQWLKAVHLIKHQNNKLPIWSQFTPLKESDFLTFIILFQTISVRENLTNVLHSHFTSILPGLKMAVDKGKGGIFKVEPDSDRAFVSCHSREPSLDLELPNEAYFLSMLFFSKHDDVAANHDFLNDWDILHSLWVPI